MAPRLGQIPEIVRDGETGLLYTPGHLGELAQRLLTLAERADLRATLGRRAAQEAHRRSTWRATAQRVVAISEQAAQVLSACP